MKTLDHSLPKPADNLACDEDLLGQAWQIDGQAEAPDTNAIGELARRKYGNPEWIYRRP